MKKLLIKLFCSFIRNKDKKRTIRASLASLSLSDVFHFYRFKKLPVRKNSVLLIEANDSHGEVIAGYLKYFQNLGYRVDVLLNSKIATENPFCRLDVSDVRVFVSGYLFLKKFLKQDKISEYKHIMLMTSAVYFYRENDYYISALRYYPELKKHPSLLIVEHELNDIEKLGEQSFVKMKRLITLGHFSKGVFAAPVLFGNLRITQKNELTTFICVGSIRNVRKNYQQLIDATLRLVHENKSFKIVIVGDGKLEHLPQEVHPYIEITGRLDFPKMFSKMEEADFYLPLLDAENVEHERYITTGVTGSAQLIYAFAKVPVLHPKFAPFYRFNDQNAIVTKDLFEGMKQAVEMSEEEYALKQKALKNLAVSLEKETQNNFKDILQ